MKKRKTISQRLLALTLCLLCLLAAMPIAALADDGTEPTAVTETVELPPESSEASEPASEPSEPTGEPTETSEPSGAPTEAVTEPSDPSHNGDCVDGCTVDGCPCACHLTPTEPPAEATEPTGEPEATEETEGSEETTVPTEPESTPPSFYDRLLACESCQEMYFLLAVEPVENVEALTYDQLTNLLAYVDTLPIDNDAEDLIFDLVALRDGDISTLDPWDGGGGNECDQKYYQSNAQVFYDTMSYNRSTKKGSSYAAGRAMIDNVELTNKTVVQKDATKPSNATGGTKMSEYFSGANADTEVTSTLKITPKAGYYITDVVIACTGGQSDQSAFMCNTWSEGNAFTKDFDVGTGGSVSISVSSKDFSHRSTAKKVFILIAVAPIPTPLYVEYWPGSITEYSTDAIFKDSDSWTQAGSGNVLGTGQVDTSYTQFEYKYALGNSGTAANWKHYANSVTDDAKTAAANAGYYFTGWKVEYYTSYNKQTGNTVDDRNYTYNLTEAYGTGVNKQPGEVVDLVTNCKIIAQWAPIELKVTKTVSGLEAPFLTAHEYTIQVQKQNGEEWEDFGEPQTITVTGNGSASKTLSPVTPGTYRAVEINGKDNLTNSSTIMYITVNEGGTVTYSATDTTTKELIVTNTYSSTPAAYDLTVTKLVSGNMYNANDKFTFTVTYGEGDSAATETFTLGNNDSSTVSIPVGAPVTVAETDSKDYDYALESVTGVAEDAYTKSDKGISFTMPENNVAVVIKNTKDITISTGISLETLPYILILAVVAVGAVVMVRKRRNRDED